MQLNPKIGAIANVLFLVVLACGQGAFTFAGVPDVIVAAIKGYALDLAIVIALANTVLHLFSAPAAGPLANAVAPKAVVLLALALGALLPGSAHAQGSRSAPPPVCGFDPLHLVPGCQANEDFISSLKSQIGTPAPALSSFTPQQIADKIAKLALNDFIYADGLAKATANTVTEPCWAAWVKLLTNQQQPIIGPVLTEAVAWIGPGAAFQTKSPHNLMVGEAVTFASPPAGITAGTAYYVIAENFTSDTFEVSATIGGTAVTPTGPAAAGTSINTLGQVLQRPDPGLVTGVEYLSEAVQLLQSNSPIAVACAPMAQALQKDIGTLLGQIITGGAFGLFKLPIPVGPVP